MEFRKGCLFAVLACALALCLLSACVAKEATPPPNEAQIPKPVPKVHPTPVEEITLEEAEEMIGIPLTPKYLPNGWEFKRGFALHYPSSPSRPKLKLFFSDKEIDGEVRTAQDFSSFAYKLVFNVFPIEEIPSPDIFESLVDDRGGKVVDMDGIKAWLSPEGHDLHWFLPKLLLMMYMPMPEELPAEEIVRIARSIE